MLGLPNSFFSKFQLMGLHMWLICQRLKTIEGGVTNAGESLPRRSRPTRLPSCFAGKGLVDKTHFIWLKDNEWLVYYEGVRVRFSKQMMELEKSFFGLAIACD